MKQQTFSDFEYSNRKKKTKREEFLEIMDEILRRLPQPGMLPTNATRKCIKPRKAASGISA